ncbi:MAG: phosphatidylserine/phosphatidylglycerophosphate/cardiolipin synthase family protein [Sporolactobacillus sp.]
MHLFLILLLSLIVLILLFIAGIWLDIACGLRFRHPLLPKNKLSRSFNELRYFLYGRDLFRDMRQSIDAARQHIHLSFFIFKADEVGNEWLELLKKKAEEGVDVRLLVDYFNKRGLRKKLNGLAAAGVQIAFTGKPRFPFTFYYLNRRNHRKIMVIDGQVGYFGGFNVSRDYVSKNVEMGNWHDNHVRLEGKGVAVLQELFLADWQTATGKVLPRTGLFPELNDGSAALDLIGTNANQVEKLFADELSKARRSIIIGSPYFIPSRKLLQILLEQLTRGVELTIILPMKRDHAMVKPASYSYLQPLLEKGAHVFHFYQGFYHSKVFVVDQRRCYLGTANFDQRSFFWNDELLGFSEDPALVKKVILQLNHEVYECSVPVKLEDLRHRSWIDRLKTAGSLLFSRFL